MPDSIDTLTIYERLKSASLEEAAAKEIAEVLKDVTDSNLASKNDISEVKKDIELVRSELKKDIELVRSELKKDIEQTKLILQKEIQTVKADMLKWITGMLIAQAAIVATLVKLL